MYSNLGMMEVLPGAEMGRLADQATGVLEGMEGGAIEYNAEVWAMYTQYLADCRTWSMQKAEAYGLTNQASRAFGLM